MAINKKEEFAPDLLELAEFAKALSHPARIAILQTLAEKQMCICGEIVEVLPLAQATVSQHLKELKNAGLIKGEVEGKKSCYCIDWEAFERFTGKMNTMFKNLSNQQCC